MGIGFDEGNVDDRCEVRGEADTVTSRDGLKFSTQGRFDKIVQLDFIWVPGGNPGALAPMMNGKKPIHVNFLKAQSAKAHVIASVCEGALLLAVAGLLDGFHATTHWSFVPCLKKFRNVKVVEDHPRFVVDSNRITGGDISSGLDEALKLVEILTSRDVAEGVQQMIQYYPDPPVTSKTPLVKDCPFGWETA